MAEAGTCGLDHHHIHEFMERASRLEEEPSNVRNKRVRNEVHLGLFFFVLF